MIRALAFLVCVFGGAAIGILAVANGEPTIAWLVGLVTGTLTAIANYATRA